MIKKVVKFAKVLIAIMFTVAVISPGPIVAHAAVQPQIVSKTPVNNTVKLDKWNGVLTIEYDAPVALGNGLINLYWRHYNGSTTVDSLIWYAQANNSNDVSVSADGYTVTIDMDWMNFDFNGDRTNELNDDYKNHFWISNEGGAIVSQADNSVNAQNWGPITWDNNDSNWSVYVQATPPQPVTFSPYIGETNVIAKGGKVLILTFEEDIWNLYLPNNSVIVYRYDSGVSSWAEAPQYVCSAEISSDHYKLRITLPSALDNDTYYGVMIPGINNTVGSKYQFFTDFYSAPFEGIDFPSGYVSLPFEGCWYFRTASDYSMYDEPVIESVTPAAGSTQVPADSAFSMTFNKTMWSVTDTNKYIYVHKYSDDSIVKTILNTDVLAQGAGLKTISLGSLGLAKNTKYYITIDSGAFVDSYEMLFDGLNDKSWYFTTTSTYTLNYTAGSNGSISGDTSQTVDYGNDGTKVTAEPDSGYHFVQWSDGNTSASRTDTGVTGNINVTANFAVDTYTLTYTAGANGSISGDASQTVDHGSDGTEVTAEPDTGYHFVQWSDGNTSASRTDTSVTDDIGVTATFAINTYTLEYTAGDHGSITGETWQTVNHGSDGTEVTAEPDTGYHFVAWSDGVDTASRTDTGVTGNIDVTATFAINTYTLDYTAGANGSVSGDTSQTVNYGSDGTEVTAEPDTGYHFEEWSDGVNTANRTDTGVTESIDVTATFAINTYTLEYAAGANGSVSGDTSQTVNYGSDGTEVTAEPDTGYHFEEWSDGVNTANRTDTGVTESIDVTATFAINTYTLEYAAGANGSVSGDASQTATHGSDGTEVTAEPDTGYHFVEWSDGVNTASRTDTGVTENIDVTATFAINTYTLEYSAGANGSVSGDTSQTVNYGSDGTEVTAEPDTGYHFVEWSDGVNTASRTDTGVTENIDVTATFAINTYTLEYSAGANGSVSGDTSQTVNHGSDGTEVTAEPDTGYHFVRWSDGVTTQSRTDKSVTKNIKVIATFAINTYSLEYTAGANGSISGDASQTVNHGSDGSTVTAEPETGYHFVQWSDGVTTASRTENSVTKSIDVTATFEINAYTLEYAAGANGSVSGDTSQTVDYGGDGTEVTAEPDTGYHFVQWSDGVDTASRTDTGVTENLELTATFEKDEEAPDTSEDNSNEGTLPIKPETVEKDEESGTVTLIISLSDLPKGTAAIELPNGKVVKVDEKHTVEVTVDENDLDADGMINIVALNEEGVPLADYNVQVENTDFDNLSGEVETDTNSLPAWLWIIIGLVGAGVVVLTVYLILRKGKVSK